MIRAPRILAHPPAVLAGVLVVAGFALPGRALAQKANDQLDHTYLPIPEPDQPPHHRARRPRRQGPAAVRGQGAGGAPNVLIVLSTTSASAMSSAFGGPIHTPTADRLAERGCATTSSTPPRSARRRARRCSPAATITCATSARSPRPPRLSRATPGSARTTSPRWPRCCGSTATAPAAFGK